MLTYLNKITDTRTHMCTEQMWERLIASPPNKQYIEMFRETGDVKWKQLLPAVNFHGYDPKVLQGLDGSRKQEDLVPTGLFMLDIDHVANPKEIWEKLGPLTPKGGTLNSSRAKSSHKTNNDLPLGGIEGVELALVHITPSGEGVRIVMKGRPGSNIKDDQKWLANLLGVKHDECTKDLSRWSFVPSQKDILYINPEILFSPTPQAELNYNETSIFAQKGQTPLCKNKETEGGIIAHNQAKEGSETQETAQKGLTLLCNFPESYHGISYEKIVDALIQYHGGTPEVGDRHHRIITLANDLRSITDSNVDWMRQLIPSFGKPEFEKRDAITWAVQHNSLRKTKALSAVLDWLQNGKPFEQTREEEDGLTYEEKEERVKAAIESIPQMPEKLPNLIALLTSKVMPFQKPAVAQMVFPSLAAHVADSIFINNENKKFELSLMGVLVGKQSVGKGCIDAPTECIISSILMEDEQAREELRAWAESQQNKKANEKGSNRPEKPIRILNTDTTPAALLANLYNAQHNGYAKNLCCFTKSEEIEEMYDMSPTAGRSKVAQLIKKTYDRGRIGSERFTSSAANYTTVLRWNWITACTPDKAKAFFKRVLVDGTLSRVDFATIIPTEEDIRFVYGDYDEAFENALEPYIQNLRNFRCEHDAKGRLIPFRLAELNRIEEEMDDYIREYSKTMPDDTWRNYAWRTKLNALKKILVLYIANGGEWEESFESFCWWSFFYGMWVKMNLFYQQASEAFGEEEFFSEVSVGSPLDYVNEIFTKDELEKSMRLNGFKTKTTDYICTTSKRGKIIKLGDKKYKKI